MANLNFLIYMIILTINLYKAIAGEGAFVNGQQLVAPNDLKLQDAIISLGLNI